MTLLVGIRCSDGVAIGTDTAVTFSAFPKTPTIEQQASTKLEVVDQAIIIASTGQHGMAQRFVDVVHNEHLNGTGRLRSKDRIETGRVLSELGRADFSRTQAPQGQYGALVAINCKTRTELIELDIAAFQPEVKDDQTWYVSMGSGQIVADPLLGLFRDVFWQGAPPNLRDGVFALTMVLDIACRMAPFGVSLPMQIATLERVNQNQARAHKLTEAELLEHQGSVKDAIQYFRGYKDALTQSKSGSAEVPVAPELGT